MKRLLLFFSVTLLAAIPTSLLQIEAKLYPRIILLEKPPPIQKNRLSIQIIHSSEYEEVAKYFAKLLLKQRLPYPIVVKIATSPTGTRPSAYILIHARPYEVFWALKKEARPIFCLLPSDIRWCTHSIVIDTKVAPLLNPYLIKAFKLRYDPILYKIGKFYEK